MATLSRKTAKNKLLKGDFTITEYYKITEMDSKNKKPSHDFGQRLVSPFCIQKSRSHQNVVRFLVKMRLGHVIL